MINIVDIESMRDNIKSYIIDQGYFSNYDIDVNDIVQMIIDIFSYSTSTLSTQIIQQENNLLLYQTEDPDMIMNLMPLFGYAPNFGSPMSGTIELYLTQQTINTLNSPIQNTGQTLLQLLQSAGMNQLLVYTQGSNITISTPVLTSNSSTVAQTLNWITQNNVYLYQSDLQQQINSNSTCPLRTQNGDTSVQVIQQQLMNVTYNQVQGIPFEKFVLEQSIQRKTQIVNNTLVSTLSFEPTVTVTLNNNSQNWNIYSSILDQTSDLDNFIMFYLDPVTMILYAQQGDDILNGNVLPQGATITVNYYETYGSNVLNSANVLSGNISTNVQIPGSLIPYSLSMSLAQPTKLYGGLTFQNINQIKQNALIVGNIGNRLVTQTDFITYTNYYITNYLSYDYSTVNVYSSFGENSLYVTPVVAQTNLVGSVEPLESWEQSLLQTQLTALAPMTTYIVVQQPTIYNIQTTGSAITIYVQSGVNIDSVISQFEQTLNNYFNINTFNIFGNFDVLDFVTQVNQLQWINIIDYNSVVNQMCLTNSNGVVVSTIDKTQNNSIIQLPSSTLFNALSISNINFSFQMYNTDGSISILSNVTYDGSTVNIS